MNENYKKMLRKFPRDNVLRIKTEEVDATFFGSDECMRIYEEMRHVMRLFDGVGLAAPQIGISNSIFVVELDDVRLQGKIHGMCINPEVIPKQQLNRMFTTTETEGCLSCQGTIKVTRDFMIGLKYYDWEGNCYIVNLEGFPARVVQHEMDHLKGKLIVDYSSKFQGEF